MISVVLPYCHKDRIAAIRLLEWIRELDGDRALPSCFLVSSKSITDAEDKEVINTAFGAFQDVWIIKQKIHDESQGALLRCAEERMKSVNGSWVFIEPDSKLPGPRWLSVFEAKQKATGLKFVGTKADLPLPANGKSPEPTVIQPQLPPLDGWGINVSILVPTRNNPPEHLMSFWKSILDQTYPWWELVIIDDSDRKDTIAALEDIASCNQVSVIRGPGKGITHALNSGLVECKNELVARMDADDIMRPERLAKQVSKFLSHPWIDILGTQMSEFIESASKTVFTTSHPKCVRLSHLVSNRWGMNHPSVMFRKSRIMDIGGYNCSIEVAEDHELWMRAAKAGYALLNLPDDLLLYRQHEKQSHLTILEFPKKVAELVKRFLIPNRKTVCFVAHSLYYGGAEQWLFDLILSTHQYLDWSFVGVEGYIDTDYKSKLSQIIDIETNPPKVLERAQNCDVVLVWTSPRPISDYAKKGKIILVSHTSATDAWVSQWNISKGDTATLAVGVSSTATEALKLPVIGVKCKTKTIVPAISEHIDRPLYTRERYRSKFGISQTAFVIGYIGRLTKEKRFDSLLALAKNLPEGMCMAIAGQSWPPDTFNERIPQMRRQSGGRAIFLGWVEDKASFFNAMDCILNLSTMESFGLTFAETWVSGTPLVCSLAGVATEHPDWLTPITNPEDQACILDAIAKCREVGPDLAKKVKPKAKALFKMDRFAKEWVDTINSL